ncbi:MAG: hypothetical protein CL489_08830 [Acidobacteria bacterium]|nr:hypothetical protein [Acidobacteriota bacterium]|tara:strand:- start:3536 stop:3985 length:450 start_codon:yes stop_codon:yes gene_type:complete
MRLVELKFPDDEKFYKFQTFEVKKEKILEAYIEECAVVNGLTSFPSGVVVIKDGDEYKYVSYKKPEFKSVKYGVDLFINKILFNADPANTCCVENDVWDEYFAEAVEFMISDESDINNVLSESFGTEIELDETTRNIINGVKREIQRAL